MADGREEAEYVLLGKEDRDGTRKNDLLYMKRLREEARREYLEKREVRAIDSEREAIEDLEVALGLGILDTREIEELNARKLNLSILEGYLKGGFEKQTEHELTLETKQLSSAGIREAGVIELKKKLEGADRLGADEFPLIAPGGGRIRFDAVFANSLLQKPESEADILKRLPPEERATFIARKRQGIRQRLETERKLLPIYPYREELIRGVEDWPFLIVVGTTGSGKTTQLAQYLLESGRCKVGCTQPRRVAAMSVAARVAEEMGVRLGYEVGYKVRFDDKSGSDTKLLYMTDGMLIRELYANPYLSSFDTIIIDEAHERTVMTDILFGLLKDVAAARPEFRVIVCSATLDAKKFSDYFGKAPIFDIPGRKFAVDIFYLADVESSYLDATVATVLQIHDSEPIDGDVLVFLPGQAEIEDIESRLVEATGRDTRSQLLIVPCYSALSADQQEKIFATTPAGCRKVVLATNIAETSITIDNVVFVVDSGFVKQMRHNPRLGTNELERVPISRASADQRAGRAGRVRPGKAYRIYSRNSLENDFAATSVPEILRTDLTGLCLSLKCLGMDDLVHFDYIDSPPQQLLIGALNGLYNLQALNNKGEVTQTGFQMNELPLRPQHAIAILKGGTNFGCVAEVVTIVAVLSCDNSLWVNPKGKRKSADAVRRVFQHPKGDHLTLLKVYLTWAEAEYSRAWCREHFIQDRALERAKAIKEQIEVRLEDMGIRITSKPGDDEAIRKAFVPGAYKNIGKLNGKGEYTTIKARLSVKIHPSSVLASVFEEISKDDKTAQHLAVVKKRQSPYRPKLVLFDDLVYTSREFIRNVIEIEPAWVLELLPHVYKHDEVHPSIAKPNKGNKGGKGGKGK